MNPDTEFALEIAGAVIITVLIVVIVVATSSSACVTVECSSSVMQQDVELALGAATLVTYEQAVAWKKGMLPRPPSSEGKEKGSEEDYCSICLSEYSEGDKVRMIPACGHFFHAECENEFSVDAWLRKHRTCPLCRRGLCSLPACRPMPPRVGTV